MTIPESNKQRTLEDALKLAFIKLQQTDGFRPSNGSKVPDVKAYVQILDTIRTFDPKFSFGKDPAEVHRDAVILSATLANARKDSIINGSDDIHPEQAELITEWFWDVLPRDYEHADRRQTGQGTKTKLGLLNVMRRIVKAGDGPSFPVPHAFEPTEPGSDTCQVCGKYQRFEKFHGR